MRYRLSLVIPIYKVENYIRECLNSIFSRIPASVEIIMVNDGTPDRSIEIIKLEYAEWLIKDQVVLIEQENAGPGAARNRGLEVARGEYIGFLDSDDIILNNYFQTLLKIIQVQKVDIIEFGFKRFHSLSDIVSIKYRPLYKLEGQYKLQEVREKIFSVGVWFPGIRIYKKKIFHKLRFPEGVFYEDLMCISQIYLKDLSVYFLNKPLIGYRFNPNSTTSVHTESHAVDMYRFYRSLDNLEQSISVFILKIKVGRSIAYFFTELRSSKIPIQRILYDIRKIPYRIDLIKYLKFPDMLFFVFPRFYMLIDRIRLQRKRQ